MWPFLNRALFPPPTEAWLQMVSSDPEAQGWGAWGSTEKTPAGPGGGQREGKEGDAEDDAGFLLSLLEPEHLAECPAPDQVTAARHTAGTRPRAEGCPLPPGGGACAGHRAQGRPPGRQRCAEARGQATVWGRADWAACQQELEAIKLKLWAMEQAEDTPELPRARGEAGQEEGARAVLARQPPGTKTSGCPFPGAPKEKVEADHRSIYVGNVDYGGTAEELEAYFNHCGEIHRVTILCDKFSGHPKGYAYIEFATKSSAQAAVELDESVFRGRVIKVLPKRTNFPGISSTDRGGLRLHPGPRAAPFPRGSLQGRPPRFRPRGQSRGRGRAASWFVPY
ncbi:embryonic polyadenylate-binding protein 2 isoform X2 [Oryctolagus cuniculus]|uniref:embryonic polyadenylate-binding protein 2 isoform X2 n=1 Tax=Oryctolagus cuniculus TaxID=9986 RepID=UPI00387984D6